MKCQLVNENFKEDYIDSLLRARGVAEPMTIKSPTRDALLDPTLLSNMKEGADLYIDKISNGKRIVICVDCDNDGFTSAAIIHQFSLLLNPNIEVIYLLHEHKQHGLEDHVHALLSMDEKIDLIILPDSSTNDYEYHEQLKEVAPCLVLDHHELEENVPISSNAIIINNQISPDYPNKELTGAGVVWQFCRYVSDVLEKSCGEYIDAEQFIDLAAWGIIGDMGSVLEPENAYIISKGLKNIKNKFFKNLLEKQSYSIVGNTCTLKEMVGKITPISVAFYIVPLTNATIRVGSLAEKTRLYEAYIDADKMVPSGKRGHKGELDTVGNEAARECTNNKAHQNKAKEEAVEKMEMRISKYDLLENKVLFIRLEDDDNFPAELNGLIAMQLADRYKHPTIVARLNDEGYIRGSARGLNQSELKDFKAFLTDSGFFEYAQGHANAFGCSIPDRSLRAFHEYANEKLKDIDLGEEIYDVNFQRKATDSDLSELIKEICKYNNIWGQQNNEPLISVTSIKINPAEARIMGKLSDTVKIEKNGIAYMWFKASDFIEELKSFGQEDVTIEVVGRANLNTWMGNVTPQIFVTAYNIKKAPKYEF